jgi:hypothetical protein
MLSKEKSEKSIEGITVVNLPAGELNGLFTFYPMGERKEQVKIPIVVIYNVRQLAMYIAEYLKDSR